MLLILIAIIVAAIIGAILFFRGIDGYDLSDLIATIIGLALMIGAGCAAVVYAFAAWSWYASAYQAEIINREYGTHYTREEVFYASDVIDTIRELNRKRVEVNGDLFRDKPDQ